MLVSNPNGVNLHSKSARDTLAERCFKPQRGKFTLRLLSRNTLRAVVSNPNGVNLHSMSDGYPTILPSSFKPQRGKFTQMKMDLKELAEKFQTPKG